MRNPPSGDDNVPSASRIVIGQRCGTVSILLGNSAHSHELVQATSDVYAERHTLGRVWYPSTPTRVNGGLQTIPSWRLS